METFLHPPFHSFRHQLVIVLTCLLWVAVASAQDTKITCSVPSVMLLEDTVLTCHFPEDISVSKKNFAVFHYVKDGSPDAVLDCWWASNRLKCVKSPGIEYEVVNSELKLTFRHVTLNHNGTYSCHLDGYGSTHIETCDFQIQDVTLVEKVDQSNNTLAIVLGLLVSNFFLVAGIVSLRGKIQVSRLLFRQSNKNPVGEKSCPMPTLQDYVAVDEKTKKLLQCLVDDVKGMYPEILDSCHFVPPVYFNKTRYKTHVMSGGLVYSPVIPDIKNAKGNERCNT